MRPAGIDTPIFRHAANFSGRRLQALTPTYPPEQAAEVIVEADRPPEARGGRRRVRGRARRGAGAGAADRRPHLRRARPAEPLRRRRERRADDRQRVRARSRAGRRRAATGRPCSGRDGARSRFRCSPPPWRASPFARAAALGRRSGGASGGVAPLAPSASPSTASLIVSSAERSRRPAELVADARGRDERRVEAHVEPARLARVQVRGVGGAERPASETARDPQRARSALLAPICGMSSTGSAATLYAPCASGETIASR